jgi:thiamine biosynthesis protein ThiS
VIAVLPRLHAVTDDRVIAAGNVVSRAAAMSAAAGDALAVHLRSRALEGAAFLELARELGAALKPHGSWLVVNGRADVARAADAHAVVSGRGGLSVTDVRRVAPAVLVARSVHDEPELRAATIEGADFLIGSTGEKSGTGVFSIPLSPYPPLVAIGGISPENVTGLLERGAFGIAAIRALWDAPDPAAAARAFLARLPKQETVRVVINGETRRARRGITLAGLLADLGLDARAVVVEHNRGIVRQGALEATKLAEDDAIELVHFVGGG